MLWLAAVKVTGITNMLHPIKEFGIIIIIVVVKMASEQSSRVGFACKM